jgi:hypothetical protein
MAYSCSVRPIFLRWERLRIAYNALLLLLTIGWLAGIRDELVLPGPLEAGAILVVGALLANACFTAAPLVEAHLACLGLRSRLLTPLLFAAGALVSVPLVLLFLLAAFGWTIG